MTMLSFRDPFFVKGNERLAVTISRESGELLVRFNLEKSDKARALRSFQLQASYFEMNNELSGRFESVDAITEMFSGSTRSTEFQHIQPWRDVEEIAEHVQGDGTDPLRIALADSIRQCQRAKNIMENE